MLPGSHQDECGRASLRPAAYLASLAVFQSGPSPLDLHGSVLLQLAPWCRTRNLGGEDQETLPSWWQSPCDKFPCFEKIDVVPRHSVSPSRPRHLVCHADGILAQSRPPCITHPTVYLGNSTTSWSLDCHGLGLRSPFSPKARVGEEHGATLWDCQLVF